MPRERTGLLIIRAWVEDDSAEPLRAHIRVTTDIANGIERTLNLTCPDTISELIDTWLDCMLRDDTSPHTP